MIVECNYRALPLTGVAIAAAILVAAGAWGQTPTPTAAPPSAVFYHNAPPSSGGIDAALIDLIDASAQPGGTIDLAIYSLDLSGIADALVVAHAAGAAVRVIAEASSACANEECSEFEPSFQTIADAGIPVRTNSLSRTGLMHNKFCVSNGRFVWTGSWNPTDAGTVSDSNDAVLTDSASLAQAYTAEFDEMWEGSYGAAKTDNTAHHFDVGDIAVDCYFAPTDGVKNAVLQEIDTATSAVHFLIFSFTDEDVAEAMVQKASLLDVRGVFDKAQGQGAYSQITRFTRNGVAVKLDSFPGKLHHKALIIDRDGPDPRVITGSYNLTASAEADNDENIVVIHSPELAAEYDALFEEIYANHAEPPPPVAEGRLVLSEVLANGFFRFFDIAEPSNWGPSSEEQRASPGEENAVDTVPPEIIHTPVTDVLTGRSIYIHCRVEDNEYLYSAKDPTLHYRLAADPPIEYTTTSMGALFDEYYATIPAGLTSEPGEDRIEYYITAKDASHNMGSAPPVNASLHPYAIDVNEAAASDSLRITEIMYDPPDAPEEKFEWVEALNVSTSTVSLDGWSFTDFDASWAFPPEASIGPNDYIILCNDRDSFNAAHPGVPQESVYEYGIAEITLPDSWGTVTGTVALLNPTGMVVHEVDYSAAWGAQNGTGPNRNTLEKVELSGPDDGTNWMYSMVRGGTPGAASSPHFVFTRYETGGGSVVTRPGIWLSRTLIDDTDPAQRDVTISYRLDRDCLVNVKIYNPPADTAPEHCFDSPYLVKTLFASPQPRAENMDLGQPPHEEVWDGKDSAGAPVYGVCRVVVEAEDTAQPGVVCRAESDDSVAAASWVGYEPDEFNVLSHQMISVLYSLTKPAHVTLRFEYQLPGQTPWNYITLMDGLLCERPEGTPAEIASRSVHNAYLWDGTDDNGNYVRAAVDYKIDLEARGDIYGNIVLSRSGSLAIPALVLSPRGFFDPYGGGVQNISYELSKACDVTVSVVDGEGNAVRTLLDGAPQGAGTHELAWDGRNGAGDIAPDGKYMVVVSATTDAGESCREVAESVVCSISDPAWVPQSALKGESE